MIENFDVHGDFWGYCIPGIFFMSVSILMGTQLVNNTTLSYVILSSILTGLLIGISSNTFNENGLPMIEFLSKQINHAFMYIIWLSTVISLFTEGMYVTKRTSGGGELTFQSIVVNLFVLASMLFQEMKQQTGAERVAHEYLMLLIVLTAISFIFYKKQTNDLSCWLLFALGLWFLITALLIYSGIGPYLNLVNEYKIGVFFSFMCLMMCMFRVFIKLVERTRRFTVTTTSEIHSGIVYDQVEQVEIIQSEK